LGLETRFDYNYILYLTSSRFYGMDALCKNETELGSMTAAQVAEIAAQSGLPATAGNPAGPPPLIEGESAAEYEALLARVANALQPADVLEEIWIRDVVDLCWEVFRLRRLKAALMTSAAHEGMEQLLTPLFPSIGQGRSLARKWAAGADE